MDAFGNHALPKPILEEEDLDTFASDQKLDGKTCRLVGCEGMDAAFGLLRKGRSRK